MEIIDMKDIAIYGAGGFGREVACLINIINEKEPTWHLIGFFDDNPELKGTKISHYGICLGGMKELNDYSKDLALVIPIGAPDPIRSIVERIKNPKVYFPNIAHPDLKIKDLETFSIGQGNVFQDGCSVSCNVKIGSFNMFSVGVILGHDDVIGNYNCFMPSIKISGTVSIGDGNFFGVGSVVLQQIKIGDKVRLGAGSVLISKPKDDCLYFGNPAKLMRII